MVLSLLMDAGGRRLIIVVGAGGRCQVVVLEIDLSATGHREK
jgi:hypothetical protein